MPVLYFNITQMSLTLTGKPNRPCPMERRGTTGYDNFQAHPSFDILDGLDLTSCGLDCEPVSLRSADVSMYNMHIIIL
jgi:hypothetical protein